MLRLVGIAAVTGLVFANEQVAAQEEDEQCMLQKPGKHHHKSRLCDHPSKLCADLSGGVLDRLAAGGAPYTAKEVGKVACNMAANIFTNGTILASPSNGTVPVYSFPNGSAYLQNDYYYMWQRDAGLTMRTLLRIAGDTTAVKDQLKAYTELLVNMWYKNQTSPNTNCAPWNNAMGGYCSMYGEAKFFVNGSVYDQPWGRLQNDGPAINALVLMKYLDLKGVSAKSVRAAKDTILKVLNWVGQVLPDSTVDPWEMLYGQHFFVHIVQHRAMGAAADLAKKGVLTGDVSNFPLWAKELETYLGLHWNSEAQALTETFARPDWNPVGPKCTNSGIDSAKVYPVPQYQPCELDVATLLGALAAYPDEGTGFPEAVPAFDRRLLATADHIVQSMGNTYEVNKEDDEAGLPGVLIGRYPGDEYSGVIMSPGFTSPCSGFNCGNPWFLTTHALAEVLYSASAAAATGELKVDALTDGFILRAMELGLPAQDRGKMQAIPQTDGVALGEILMKAGDGVLIRAKHHVTKGMHMSEQIYRGGDNYPGVKTGAQFGVDDLTWSYASLLDALETRASAYKKIRAAKIGDIFEK